MRKEQIRFLDPIHSTAKTRMDVGKVIEAKRIEVFIGPNQIEQ